MILPQWHTPNKVATLPTTGSDEEKQSNEIKTAIPLLNAIDIAGKTITADALLTQHKPADHLVKQCNAHYHFTVKGNPKNLLEDIAPHFDCCERAPSFTTNAPRTIALQSRLLAIGGQIRKHFAVIEPRSAGVAVWRRDKIDHTR